MELHEDLMKLTSLKQRNEARMDSKKAMQYLYISVWIVYLGLEIHNDHSKTKYINHQTIINDKQT